MNVRMAPSQSQSQVLDDRQVALSQSQVLDDHQVTLSQSQSQVLDDHQVTLSQSQSQVLDDHQVTLSQSQKLHGHQVTNLVSMAEVVLANIQEAAGLVMCTCKNQEDLTAALARALASAEQLIHHVDVDCKQ